MAKSEKDPRASAPPMVERMMATMEGVPELLDRCYWARRAGAKGIGLPLEQVESLGMVVLFALDLLSAVTDEEPEIQERLFQQTTGGAGRRQAMMRPPSDSVQ